MLLEQHIQSLTPIEGYDYVEVATCGKHVSVVPKDVFRVGDRVEIACEGTATTILEHKRIAIPAIAGLGKRGFVEYSQRTPLACFRMSERRRRVRAKRIAGVLSNCIILPAVTPIIPDHDVDSLPACARCHTSRSRYDFTLEMNNNVRNLLMLRPDVDAECIECWARDFLRALATADASAASAVASAVCDCCNTANHPVAFRTKRAFMCTRCLHRNHIAHPIVYRAYMGTRAMSKPCKQHPLPGPPIGFETREMAAFTLHAPLSNIRIRAVTVDPSVCCFCLQACPTKSVVYSSSIGSCTIHCCTGCIAQPHEHTVRNMLVLGLAHIPSSQGYKVVRCANARTLLTQPERVQDQYVVWGAPNAIVGRNGAVVPGKPPSIASIAFCQYIVECANFMECETPTIPSVIWSRAAAAPVDNTATATTHRHRTPYIRFCDAERLKIRDAFPEISYANLGRELGRRWAAKSDAEKQQWATAPASVSASAPAPRDAASNPQRVSVAVPTSQLIQRGVSNMPSVLTVLANVPPETKVPVDAHSYAVRHANGESEWIATASGEQIGTIKARATTVTPSLIARESIDLFAPSPKPKGRTVVVFVRHRTTPVWAVAESMSTSNDPGIPFTMGDSVDTFIYHAQQSKKQVTRLLCTEFCQVVSYTHETEEARPFVCEWAWLHLTERDLYAANVIEQITVGEPRKAPIEADDHDNAHSCNCRKIHPAGVWPQPLPAHLLQNRHVDGDGADRAKDRMENAPKCVVGKWNRNEYLIRDIYRFTDNVVTIQYVPISLAELNQGHHIVGIFNESAKGVERFPRCWRDEGWSILVRQMNALITTTHPETICEESRVPNVYYKCTWYTTVAKTRPMNYDADNKNIHRVVYLILVPRREFHDAMLNLRSSEYCAVSAA